MSLNRIYIILIKKKHVFCFVFRDLPKIDLDNDKINCKYLICVDTMVYLSQVKYTMINTNFESMLKLIGQLSLFRPRSTINFYSEVPVCAVSIEYF